MGEIIVGGLFGIFYVAAIAVSVALSAAPFVLAAYIIKNYVL